MTATYTDYAFSAPAGSDFVAAQAALQAAGVLAPGAQPANILGPAPGRAALPQTLPNGLVVQSVAAGDPAQVYVLIRSVTPPDQIGINPADFGLTPCDRATAVSVVGDFM